MADLLSIIFNLIERDTPSGIKLRRGLYLSFHPEQNGRCTLILYRANVFPSDEEVRIITRELQAIGHQPERLGLYECWVTDPVYYLSRIFDNLPIDENHQPSATSGQRYGSIVLRWHIQPKPVQPTLFDLQDRSHNYAND